MEQQTKELIVTLTDKAAEKIKSFFEKEHNKNKKKLGLRVGIKKGGCSGYTYEIGFEGSPKENDTVIEEKGIKVFIDAESLYFLKGSTVDYIDTLQNSGFKIINPNVKTTCGCGHSVG